MSAVITIRSDLEARLNRVAEETGETADRLLEDALAEYLSEREAALIALRRADRGGPTVSFSQLEKELGLDR